MQQQQLFQTQAEEAHRQWFGRASDFALGVELKIGKVVPEIDDQKILFQRARLRISPAPGAAPDHRVSDLAVIAHARLVIIGGDSRRLHEEIIQAGREVRQGSFRRFETLQRMNEVWHAATDHLPAEPILRKLTALWPAVEASLQQALDLRGQERTVSLQRVLAQRAAKKAADIQAILHELAQAIRSELREEPLQLSLFNADERQQYGRNVAALEARLAQIPDEIAQEQAAITRRYVEPQARLFPVAVSFIVPERLARSHAYQGERE